MKLSRSIRLALLSAILLTISTASFAQVAITVSFGPPPLPVYEQPLCPADGYIWAPGYWAWGPYGYYWVPGTWVLAPQPGFYWTPAWWGWDGGTFLFHEGYWGPVVGFYGGIVYGFGYFGHGYEGGRWDGDRFYYNRTVNNINVTNIKNVYNTTIINNNSMTVNRVSYNGGEGGLTARPTPQEEAAARDRHLPPTQSQVQHFEQARNNPQLRASENRGKPPVAATPKPASFNEREVVPAREAGGPYKEPPKEAQRQGEGAQPGRGNPNVPQPPTHAKDVPPHPKPQPPNTGNADLDRKYQQQDEKLYTKQEQDHQKLQQKQEQDHQRAVQQQMNQEKQQQMEERHQQQTQQMEQHHQQQIDQVQRKQAPPPGHPR
jgi:hypothetical protein